MCDPAVNPEEKQLLRLTVVELEVSEQEVEVKEEAETKPEVEIDCTSCCVIVGYV